MKSTIKNAMTIDVEDYYHVSAFSKSIQRKEWPDMQSRVVANTELLIELFAEYDIKATFFVLGWVAERYPKIVHSIIENGHEVASHGYSHQLVYNQSIEEFTEETRRSKEILENLTQRPVLGYRAASYSITSKSEWALDVLHELGFKYDSSIFPVHHDRYGMPGTPQFPYQRKTIKGAEIIEFPLSSVKMFGYQLPIAGGGYFRLFPYFFSRYGLNKINKTQNPFIFYLHPWEVDPDQPRIKASLFSRFRHYNNLKKCESRLRKLVNDFSFTTVSETLSELDFKVA